MQIENLGHESWLLRSKTQNILVDPILNPEFGRSLKYRYRKLSHINVPKSILDSIDGVILTSENFQHFDRTSFDLLPTKINVFVPPTFGALDAEWLQTRGASVLRIPFGVAVNVGNLQFIFAPSHINTPPWDARVSSLLIAEHNADGARWVFIQSDTGVNENIARMIPKSWKKKPDLVVVTCHAKEYAEPGYSSWDNFINPLPSLDDPRVTFDLVQSALPLSIAPLNVARHYALAGGDYERHDRALPMAKRDNARLAELMDCLAVNCAISVATAGAIYSVGDTPKIMSLHPVEVHKRVKSFAPFSVVEPDPNSLPASDCITSQGLARFAKALLLSELGHALLFTDEYLGEKLDAKRFALKLVHTNTSLAYEFCFSRGHFIHCNKADDELLQKPAGLVLAASAFRDIMKGVASAPEICSNNAIQWYIGPPSHSPLGLLYYTFSLPTFQAVS